MTTYIIFRLKLGDSGIGGPESFRLPPGASLVIGRDPHKADVFYPCNALSRCHARLTNDDGVCTLERLWTRGDIYVQNGAVPAGGVRLAEGDVIALIGGLRLVVSTERADEGPGAQ